MLKFAVSTLWDSLLFAMLVSLRFRRFVGKHLLTHLFCKYVDNIELFDRFCPKRYFSHGFFLLRTFCLLKYLLLLLSCSKIILPRWTVCENLLIGAVCKNISRKQLRCTVVKYIAILDLRRANSLLVFITEVEYLLLYRRYLLLESSTLSLS